MKYWPIAHTTNTSIPENGTRGSFWENRADRYHAGVDLYAPVGSAVVAIESGKVIEVITFTCSQILPYWNTTLSVLIETTHGIVFRYAELQDCNVQQNDWIEAGALIGHVGKVLNTQRIDVTSPKYIQQLKDANIPSMLHLEMHNALPERSAYLGGNYFLDQKPEQLIDPTPYLLKLVIEKEHRQREPKI